MLVSRDSREARALEGAVRRGAPNRAPGRRPERLEPKVPREVAGRRPELVAPLCAAESRWTRPVEARANGSSSFHVIPLYIYMGDSVQ